MFLIVNDTKPFMKPGCSVSHSSNMMHPCKWAIGDMLSGKNILQTVDPSILKKTWKQNFRLFMKNNYLWKNAYWKILLVFLSNFFKGSLKFMLPVFFNSLLILNCLFNLVSWKTHRHGLNFFVLLFKTYSFSYHIYRPRYFLISSSNSGLSHAVKCIAMCHELSCKCRNPHLLEIADWR